MEPTLLPMVLFQMANPKGGNILTPPTIAVFGDNFIDRYFIGTSTRLSPEAPVPVVKVSEEKVFPGGAGNVVANLDALGAKILGVEYGSVPTKNRLYSDHTQVARWDENDTQEELDPRCIAGLVADAVIISDYGKGSITYAVIEAIAALNLPTFIDTKRSPRDFDVISTPFFFPNQKEYSQYINEYRLQPDVIYKRGAEGMQHEQYGLRGEIYPAWAHNVVSVCGAGDTVIAAYTYAWLMKNPSPLAFASAAAAVVVGKPWTATATVEEIYSFAANDYCAVHWVK